MVADYSEPTRTSGIFWGLGTAIPISAKFDEYTDLGYLHGLDAFIGITMRLNCFGWDGQINPMVKNQSSSR